MTDALAVRPISDAEHLAFLETRPAASFLQTPAWGRVKSDWRAQSLGWYAGDQLVGAGLVLHRSLPGIGRTLAYLPEGPVIDWTADDLRAWLAPMVAVLKAEGAFGIRIGPPVVTRRWRAATVKSGLADPVLDRLGDVPADATEPVGIRVTTHLGANGWRQQGTAGGFAAGQPRYVFQVPLVGPDGPRSDDDLLKAMNQLWRRNIKKAAKAGVKVRTGGRADLQSFHPLYAETAARDHFTPRPLAYFETMWDQLVGERPDRMSLYLAEHEGDLVAATMLVRVGGHSWYSYGASSTAKRDVRGSNAVQWQMMRDARDGGATVYDLRGITDTLDGDDPHVGLVTFKVGTGGEAVEHAGEWDLPLSRPLYAAFALWLRRR